MTNRAGSSSRENRNFLTTGRPPDRNWMDMKRIRPTWMGNETRNTMDSGIEFTDNRYGPTPPQPGGRKRHADEDTLQIPYADVPDSMRTMPWDGHTNVSYLNQRTQIVRSQEARHRKSDRDGPRMTCVRIRLNTGGHSTTETVRDYGYLVRCFNRECLNCRGIWRMLKRSHGTFVLSC